MADYISSLTGVAMDQALIDMAEHTSEAYAVGERNGVPVDSSDVTYHNNARYYAQQAQSIAPASVTEAVRWDVAQTALTDANRALARENIKATSYNYNLLDNSWWGSGEVINSRGITSATLQSAQYYIDRWKFTYGSNAGSFVINSNGIAMTVGDNFQCIQAIKDPNKLNGKTLTASVMLADGTIYSGAITRVNGTQQVFYNANNVYMNMRTFDDFFLRVTANMTIRAVKLEIGSFSTLAYDSPPDYGEELTRCIYSTADPTDTYANNGFGRTNPNLLDNPFWGSNEVVNQRGVTSGTVPSGVYLQDRWYYTANVSNGTYSLGTNGMTITSPSGATQRIQQRFGLGDYLGGKTITASIMLSNGSIYTGTINRTAGTQETIVATSVGVGARFLSQGYFEVLVDSGQTVTIRAVKLELGSVSTLANDVPPDYATELAKCQYYFWRLNYRSYRCISTGIATSTTETFFDAPVPVTMRDATPTVSITGTLYAVRSGTTAAITSIAAQNSVRGASLSFKGVTTGLTQLTSVPIYTAANNVTIDVSCDL